MGEAVRTSSTVRNSESRRGRLAHWLLLEGNRMTVTSCIVVAVVLIMGVLAVFDVLAVGSDGSVATLFGSGIAAGVVTLVTIALSINQLVLARVFGSPGQLSDRLDGTRDLRRTVEELAQAPSSPNDPAAFLSMIATTLTNRTETLHRAIESSEWTPPADVTTALDDISNYGSNIDDALDGQTAIVDVLDVVLGPQYAFNMTAVHHLQNEYAASLPDDAQTEFNAIERLLESIAITRQFFKTLVLQQDFAHLSRIIIYSGTSALLVAITLTLIYRTDSVTIASSTLPIVVSVGIGVIFFPLAAFLAYILRAATIAHRTVSVGPFVPPGEE